MSGVLAGLLGVGGGLIIVPALLFILPQINLATAAAPQMAVATSLASIIITSVAATYSHHRRGAVTDIADELRRICLRRCAGARAAGATGAACRSARRGRARRCRHRYRGCFRSGRYRWRYLDRAVLALAASGHAASRCHLSRLWIADRARRHTGLHPAA